MPYIPTKRNELVDKLGFMILTCPHFESYVQKLGAELAFEALDEGICNVYKDENNSIRRQLLRMSKEAKQQSEAALDLPDGQKRNGIILYASQIFVDMQRLMKGKELLNYKED